MLIPPKREKVETRLLRKAAQTEAKLENRRSAQELSFRPNIYSKGRNSRWSSARGNNKDITLVKVEHSDAPLPPKVDNSSKLKLEYKHNDHMLYFETKAEEKKIRKYSPVLESRNNKGYKTNTNEQ